MRRGEVGEEVRKTGMSFPPPLPSLLPLSPLQGINLESGTLLFP